MFSNLKKSKAPVIRSFQGKYAFLSNAYPSMIEYKGITYLNAEAAYQAQKFSSMSKKRLLSDMSAAEAKMFGRKASLPKNWETEKVNIMKDIVSAKFSQNRELIKLLLMTMKWPILAGNTNQEFFWGVDVRTGEGKNHLGKILMELRNRYQNGDIPEQPERIPEKDFFDMFTIPSPSSQDVMIRFEDAFQQLFGSIKDKQKDIIK